MQIFKVQNTDGRFCSGGERCKWTKDGKVWSNVGHVRLSFAQKDSRTMREYVGAELVTYELVEVSRTLIQDFIKESNDIREKRKQKEQERIEEIHREQKMRQLIQLKKELGVE